MDIQLIEEFKLSHDLKTQIAELLKICFPDACFYGRTYFKQLPHYRLILSVDQQLVGQLALDYRVMRLNQQPIYVLGLIDFAIHPHYQNQGYSKLLIRALEHMVAKFEQNIDFLLLTTKQPEFYRKLGFQTTNQTVQWLAIEHLKNYGIQEQYIENELMYKRIGQKKWSEQSVLDMLGYWY